MNALQWLGLLMGIAVLFDILLTVLLGRWLWKKARPSAARVPEWDVRKGIQDNESHVVPTLDKIEHLPFMCPCSPKREVDEHQNGTVAWTIIHNAMDGRKY